MLNIQILKIVFFTLNDLLTFLFNFLHVPYILALNAWFMFLSIFTCFNTIPSPSWSSLPVYVGGLFAFVLCTFGNPYKVVEQRLRYSFFWETNEENKLRKSNLVKLGKCIEIMYTYACEQLDKQWWQDGFDCIFLLGECPELGNRRPIFYYYSGRAIN